MGTQDVFIQSTVQGGYRRETWGQMCFWGAPLYGVVYRGAREGSIYGGRGMYGGVPIRTALQRSVGVCWDPLRRMGSAALGRSCGWGVSQRHRVNLGCGSWMGRGVRCICTGCILGCLFREWGALVGCGICGAAGAQVSTQRVWGRELCWGGRTTALWLPVAPS